MRTLHQAIARPGEKVQRRHSLSNMRRILYHNSTFPALRGSLTDTASEGGWGNVAVAGIGRGRWFADDELVLRYAGCGDLEQSSIGPCARGSGEQTGAGGVFGGTLC